MDIQLPRLGLGTNQFGRKVDLETARDIVAAALDEGLMLIDTAESYADGGSESIIGEALGSRRSEAILATKFSPGSDPRTACVGSLRRLRTEYVDLYQLHSPAPEIPIERTLESLAELIQEGKVRAIGNSNFAGWQVADAEWTARTRGLPRFETAQNRYSLLEREVEHDVVPACLHFGLGLLTYFPLAAGLLTGKYRRGETPAPGTRLAGSASDSPWLADRMFDRAETVASFAREHGVSLLQVAIGGLAAMPGVATVIVGATSAEQVRANARAGTWQPSPEVQAGIRGLNPP